MAESSENPEDLVGVVVDCILVDYQGDPESRDRVAQAILAWAEEHPDEWDELRARCRRRNEALV